jgi:hypothetical protein
MEPHEPDDVQVVDLSRKEIPLKLKDASGTEKEYTLREMNGEQRDKYQSLVATRARTDSQGRPVGLKSYDDLTATLISYCLMDKGTNQQVSVKAIQQWGSKSQMTIFKMCQELNGMDDDAEEKAKNA